MKTLSDSEIKRILRDRQIRSMLAYNSHDWHFHTYFAHYIEYPTAPFQHEMIKMTEDDSLDLAVITSFRGSSKSTILSLSYVTWAILGHQKKKFVLLVSQTQNQAKLMLENIKREFECNELLRRDLGPFKERDEWGSSSIVIPKYDARIMAVSKETSTRGIRHGANRPDLIIVDDPDDLSSVNTLDARNKTYDWFNGEILGCGNVNTKVIVIGNLLHENALLRRLKEDIDCGKRSGVYKEYPLINERGKIAWPGKFPNMKAIQKEKLRIGNEVTWKREYELVILPDEGQIIKPKWIKRYDVLPDKSCGFRYIATGVDLAWGQSSSSDYTAMVSAQVFGYGDNLRIYILPNPVNERLSCEQNTKRMKNLSLALSGGEYFTRLVIEDVGYQRAEIARLKSVGVLACGIKPIVDKEERVAIVAPYIETGKVLFPTKGANELINQLLFFKGAKHDDLVDALVYLLLHITQPPKEDKARKHWGMPTFIGTSHRIDDSRY